MNIFEEYLNKITALILKNQNFLKLDNLNKFKGMFDGRLTKLAKNHRVIANQYKNGEISKRQYEKLYNQYSKEVNKIKDNQNSNELEKYQNISYSEDQLDEAIVRLILFYSEIKIQDLIDKIDLSKDVSLFPKVE